jgi:hypothetical protein
LKSLVNTSLNKTFTVLCHQLLNKIRLHFEKKKHHRPLPPLFFRSFLMSLRPFGPSLPLGEWVICFSFSSEFVEFSILNGILGVGYTFLL